MLSYSYEDSCDDKFGEIFGIDTDKVYPYKSDFIQSLRGALLKSYNYLPRGIFYIDNRIVLVNADSTIDVSDPVFDEFLISVQENHEYFMGKIKQDGKNLFAYNIKIRNGICKVEVTCVFDSTKQLTQTKL